MRRLIFWLITCAAILGAYLSIDRSPLPSEYAAITPPPGLDSLEAIAAGRELFLANCAACHGITGNGQGAIKPAFGPPPADLTDRTRMPSRSLQYLFWRVSEGGQVEPFRSQGSIMPAWKYQWNEPMRWQVISYIRTLSQ